MQLESNFIFCLILENKIRIWLKYHPWVVMKGYRFGRGGVTDGGMSVLGVGGKYRNIVQFWPFCIRSLYGVIYHIITFVRVVKDLLSLLL